MSTTLPNDGLLKAARILTTILQVLLAIVGAGMVVAIPAFLFSQVHVAEAMSTHASASVGAVLAAIMGLLAVGATMMALAFYFLRLLKRIINSVGDGDPFIGENAARLTRMAWITVSIELLKIPAAALAVFLKTQLEKDTVHLNLEISVTGLLIALVLFILARVFRHGAAMREDLEGTV